MVLPVNLKVLFSVYNLEKETIVRVHVHLVKKEQNPLPLLPRRKELVSFLVPFNLNMSLN